jgi:hypothetical protein
MSLFLDRARSTDLYRELCQVPGTEDGNLLERTDPETATAQTEFLRWALQLARPRTLLEAGTHKGLFAYFVSLVLDGVEVHTVDVRPEAALAVAALNRRQQKVRCVFHEGDSRAVLPRLDVAADFAWLDGGHATDVALSDLLQCHRLGVPYVAVDDTAYPSVGRAVEYVRAHLPYEEIPNPYAAQDRRKAVLLALQTYPRIEAKGEARQ